MRGEKRRYSEEPPRPQRGAETGRLEARQAEPDVEEGPACRVLWRSPWCHVQLGEETAPWSLRTPPLCVPEGFARLRAFPICHRQDQTFGTYVRSGVPDTQRAPFRRQPAAGSPRLGHCGNGQPPERTRDLRRALPSTPI